MKTPKQTHNTKVHWSQFDKAFTSIAVINPISIPTNDNGTVAVNKKINNKTMK